MQRKQIKQIQRIRQKGRLISSMFCNYFEFSLIFLRIASDSTPQNTDSRLLSALVPNHFKPAYVSPFSRPQFVQQLFPLIGAGVKEKLREIAEDFDDGVEFLKNAFTIKEAFVSNIASNHVKTYNRLKQLPKIHGIKPLFSSIPEPYKHFPNMEPTIHTTIKIITKKPFYRYSTDGSILAACQSQFGNCTLMNKIPESHAFVAEMGLDGYKNFEKNVLRNIESLEEKKVEASLGSLGSESSESKGKRKPHVFPEWAPLETATKQKYRKKPEIPKKSPKVKSQLNTNIVSSSEDALDTHLIGNYPKKFPKVYKKPKLTPAPVFENDNESEFTSNISSDGASYNQTIFYDSQHHSSQQHEEKVEPPTPIKRPKHAKKVNFDSASASTVTMGMRKYRQQQQQNNKKTAKPQRHQTSEESRITKSIAEKPRVTTLEPTAADDATDIDYNNNDEINETFELRTTTQRPVIEKPKFEHLKRPKTRTTTTTANKRETTGTRLRDFTVSNLRPSTSTTTKKPYVDRVKVSGNRGSVKFNSNGNF